MSSYAAKPREYRANVGSLPGVARLDGFAQVDDFDRTTAYVELDLTVRLHPAAWKAAREGMPITITMSGL